MSLPFGDLSPDDGLLDVTLELTLGILATAFFWLLVLPGIWLSIKITEQGWGRQAILLFVVIMGGLARGACIFQFSEVFMFDSAAGIWQRLANSLSTTLLWLLVFALFTDAAKSFQRRYEDVFGQLAVSRAARVSGSEVEKIFSGLEAGIREISDLAIDDSKAKAEMARIAASLEKEIVTKIKSHSEALWSFSSNQVPKLRFFPLLRLAVTKLNFPISFFLAMYGMINLLNISSTVGFEDAGWRVVLALGVLAALDLVYRKLLRPALRRQALANLIFLALSGSLVQLPLGMVGYLLERSSAPVAFIVIAAISAPLIMILLSVLNLADLARRDLLDELVTVDEKLRDQRAENSSATSQLASYLHNSLQSEIQSIILALKSDSPEVSIGKSSLERLRLLSSRSLDEEFANFSSLPREHLDLVIQGWAGILEIDIDWKIDPAMSEDSRVATVVQIIEEVASNSAVHGRASKMTARVRFEESAFFVEVSNNAIDLVSMGDRGQGSRWLAGYAVNSLDKQATGEYRKRFKV